MKTNNVQTATITLEGDEIQIFRDWLSIRLEDDEDLESSNKYKVKGFMIAEAILLSLEPITEDDQTWKYDEDEDENEEYCDDNNIYGEE